MSLLPKTMQCFPLNSVISIVFLVNVARRFNFQFPALHQLCQIYSNNAGRFNTVLQRPNRCLTQHLGGHPWKMERVILKIFCMQSLSHHRTHRCIWGRKYHNGAQSLPSLQNTEVWECCRLRRNPINAQTLNKGDSAISVTSIGMAFWKDQNIDKLVDMDVGSFFQGSNSGVFTGGDQKDFFQEEKQ